MSWIWSVVFESFPCRHRNGSINSWNVCANLSKIQIDARWIVQRLRLEWGTDWKSWFYSLFLIFWVCEIKISAIFSTLQKRSASFFYDNVYFGNIFTGIVADIVSFFRTQQCCCACLRRNTSHHKSILWDWSTTMIERKRAPPSLMLCVCVLVPYCVAEVKRALCASSKWKLANVTEIVQRLLMLECRWKPLIWYVFWAEVIKTMSTLIFAWLNVIHFVCVV